MRGPWRCRRDQHAADVFGASDGTCALAADAPVTPSPAAEPIVPVWRHTPPWLTHVAGDGCPADRVPADRDAGPHPLRCAPGTRCEKSKGPVQRRPQKYRLWIQSVFSQAGLSQLDGVMVAGGQGAPDDLRFRSRSRVTRRPGDIAAVRGDPRRCRLPAIREGDLLKLSGHMRQKK